MTGRTNAQSGIIEKGEAQTVTIDGFGGTILLDGLVVKNPVKIYGSIAILNYHDGTLEIFSGKDPLDNQKCIFMVTSTVESYLYSATFESMGGNPVMTDFLYGQMETLRIPGTVYRIILGGTS